MEALTGLGRMRERTYHRPAEIDDDIRKAEALLRHNLSFRGLLRPSPPSRTSLSHTASNRHASDTRIGLMDCTVPVEALVNSDT
jgi:hypothetical protein